MFIMKYGSFIHISSILLALLILTGLYFLLRKKTFKTQKIVIWIMLLLNVFQHFFKFIVWPHCYGTGFNLINTAYNMCAFLIISSPIIYLTKKNVWKDFIFYVGSIAGILAISVPYWFVNSKSSIFTWEYLRFYVCHLLLFLTSSLPVLLKQHKLIFKNFWKFGLIFILAESIILLDNYLVYGINLHFNKEELFNAIYTANPTWSMHPPVEFPKYGKIMEFLSPGIFLPSKTSTYTPILWNAIPIYIGITLLGILFGMIADFRGFKEYIKYDDRKKLKQIISNIKINNEYEDSFNELIKDIITTDNYLKLKEFIAHSDVSVYTHSVNVAYVSYLFAKDDDRYDLNSLVRGALLHDYYLYDWHDKSHPKLHGFRHPLIALKKASLDYELNKIERDIIKKHMFPFTFYLIPKYKESWLVSKVDTKLALLEMKKERN